jgi:lipopolysaccharide transport system permease protein
MITTLRDLLLSPIRNRELVVEMAKRELKGSGRGAVLGSLWLVLSPLIQTLAYVVIVSFIFAVRGAESGNRFDYALYVLAGMVPWHVMTRSIQEATLLIRERMELVKQVIYPIETLPLTTMLVCSVGSLVALALYIVLGAFAGALRPSLLLLPLPALMLLLFILGVSWIFSIAGALLKDLREITSIVLGLLVYVSPVVLKEEMVSERLWSVVMLNPLAHVVTCFRDVFYGQVHATSWLVFAAMTLCVFAVGAWVITRTKTMINEYI